MPTPWKKCPAPANSVREVTETWDRALETLDYSAGLPYLADQLGHLTGDDAAECVGTERIDLFDATKREAGFRNPDRAVGRGNG